MSCNKSIANANFRDSNKRSINLLNQNLLLYFM